MFSVAQMVQFFLIGTTVLWDMEKMLVTSIYSFRTMYSRGFFRLPGSRRPPNEYGHIFYKSQIILNFILNQYPEVGQWPSHSATPKKMVGYFDNLKIRRSFSACSCFLITQSDVRSYHLQ